ncbi:MAG: AAA family ATPase [Prevotellaceae bacterium]|jgi:predicted ATP-binding protein involved in virulence|nr:AAA family ATPase [Prevotellaceae bacterium]
MLESEKISACYIKEVTLPAFKCFKEKHKFSFVDEHGGWCQWTVFLGNNNAGKTNLLKEIAIEEWQKNIHGYGVVRVIKSQGIATEGGTPPPPEMVVRAIESQGITTTTTTTPMPTPMPFVRDIKSQDLSFSNLAFWQQNTDNLLNNSKLINFEDWLFQLDYAAKNKQQRAKDRLTLLKSVIISDIFPEINDMRFVSDEKLSNYIEFKTKDGWYKFAALGYGYQATLSWMCDFCKKMFDRYPDSEQPLREPAALLVDELDLHLHPQWQRTIIKYLSDIFPATQFIVTTHSPFIIQSMQRVNLYTLQRDGDHTLVRHYGMRSFLGWRIEEILSEIIGLEDNIQTDTYQALMKQFSDALSEEDYRQGKQAYDGLMNILHPQSMERKLLDIQLSQLIPDDKA